MLYRPSRVVHETRIEEPNASALAHELDLAAVGHDSWQRDTPCRPVAQAFVAAPVRPHGQPGGRRADFHAADRRRARHVQGGVVWRYVRCQ